MELERVGEQDSWSSVELGASAVKGTSPERKEGPETERLMTFFQPVKKILETHVSPVTSVRQEGHRVCTQLSPPALRLPKNAVFVPFFPFEQVQT